jgi:heme-degrading monooxygenase HmoA
MKVYRLDKFVVPNEARNEFLEKINEIHSLLRVQPGFIRDYLLEQSLGEHNFNLVTFIEWEGSSFIESAKLAVMELNKSKSFNAQEMMARLGIKGEIGTYKSITCQNS